MQEQQPAIEERRTTLAGFDQADTRYEDIGADADVVVKSFEFRPKAQCKSVKRQRARAARATRRAQRV